LTLLLTVDTAYNVGCHPNLVEEYTQLQHTRFIFQQDGAAAHTARIMKDWLQANCPDFITEDQWPPNSPDLNPMDYHVLGGNGTGLS